MARDGAGAGGYPAVGLGGGLVGDVRSDLQRLQLAAVAALRRPRLLAQLPVLGALLRRPRQCLVRLALLPDHVPGGAQIRARGPLRGGLDRRRQRLAEIPAHHAADDAQHHRHYRAVLAHRHLRQLRHRARTDRRRPARHDACLRHLGLQARHRERRHPLGRVGVALHVPDPRHLRHLHPARSASARKGDLLMTAVAADAPRRVARGSLKRSRRWALVTSYFFLILFAIFFLVPPFYTLVTATKNSEQISNQTTNPSLPALPPTMDNIHTLHYKTAFLIYVKNTPTVTGSVPVLPLPIPVPSAFSLGRMKFWGSGILATGVFLTYLVPDSLLFLPLFKVVGAFGLLDSYWGLILVYPIGNE